jgi:hypothetical protein
MKLKEKIDIIFYNYFDAEKLYLIAFSIYLTGEVFGTTMFLLPGKIFVLCKLLAIGLLALKMLGIDQFKVHQYLVICFLMADAVLVALFSGYTEVLMWMIFLVAAKEVSFDKILKVYFTITFSIIVIAMLASLMGIIVNLQYVMYEKGRIRNSFGIVYPTDFASHIFYLMLTFLYLKRKQLSNVYYISCIAICIMVYLYCYTRLDVSCMFFAALGYWILDWSKGKYTSLRKKYLIDREFKRFFVYSMPIATAIMFTLTILYNPNNIILLNLDRWLSSRLDLGKRGLFDYPIKLFGQYVYMNGNGFSTKTPNWDKYFFVDCSYIYNYLRYGLVFLLVLLIVYVACCKKYYDDKYFLLTVALISLNCMIAHHLIELAYNPFALALFAKCSIDTPKRCFLSG